MKAIWKREVASYFKTVTGWLISAFLLIFVGIYCMAYNLSGYTNHFEYVLSAVSFVYLIAVPILSMRTLAEEKHQKTDQLLYSMPVTMTQVVMGKYLSMLTVLAFPLCITAIYPLILARYGSISFLTSYGTLFAFYLLGACLLSIGLFISSITESQLASAVITLVVMLLLYFMTGLSTYVSTEGFTSMIALEILAVLLCIVLQILTKNMLVTVLVGIVGLGGIYLWYEQTPTAFSGLFTSIMQSISLFERFDTFVDGVFDLTAVIYYLSIIVVFIFLTIQSMEKRRWNE